jgi:WhiB family redox-sensing transcriptional regulator
MTVLFSELLVPGWAQDGEKIGLGAVTGAYGSDIAFALPCHNSDPDLFFSETAAEINVAKSLCGQCPVQTQCLEAALSRQEPCGVWGGELFEDGSIIAKRRTVGRPRLAPAMEAPLAVSVSELELSASSLQVDEEEEESNAA